MDGNAVGPARCLELIRGITSESPQEREAWSDVAALWNSWGELDDHESRTIAVILAWAAVVETDIVKVREGLLNSLDSLAQSDLVPTYALELVTSGISRQNLDVSELEYYDTFVNKLCEQQAPPDSRTPDSPSDS